MFRNNIQLNILVKEQMNITTPFYDEISKYSQSILANISSTKQWKIHPKFRYNWGRQFRSYKCKKIQNKHEKHLPWILCRGLGMFLKQLDQFMLQYYSFKAESMAKQQKCRELWQYAWRHRLQPGCFCLRQLESYPFILLSMVKVTHWNSMQGCVGSSSARRPIVYICSFSR
jgi:hypothetical protein